MPAADTDTNESHSADVERELVELAASGLPPGEFFRELLAKSIDATGAVAAAAWGLTPQGVLAQISAIQFTETEPAQSPAAARRHVQLLLETLHRGQARLHCEESAGASREASPVRSHTILLVPIRQQHNSVGVLEVFLQTDTPSEDAADRLAALAGLSQSATQYLERRSVPRPQGTGNASHRGLVSFLEQLYRDLRVSSVAMTMVNEGRLLLGCERASLVAIRGKKSEILAISGQDRVRQNSNLVRAMTELASVVVSTGQPLHFQGDLEELPPHVHEPLVAYLAESGASSVTALPLYEPPPRSVDDAENFESSYALGLLLLEWYSEGADDVPEEYQQAVAAHSAQALHNVYLHEGAYLSPLWRFLHQRRRKSDKANQKRRGLYAACACIGLVLVMLMPVPYYVQAEGELVPAVRLSVFAPEDGEVVEVMARGGDRIDRGQVLVRLHNAALTSEHLQARNRLTETEQSLAALVAQRGTATEKGARDAAIRLEGRIAQTKIEVDGIRLRLAALEQELANLEVRSVAAGTVATFQPNQQLLHRPVRRGEVLLEIIDESGPWQLELEIPARRLGNVLAAREAQPEERLPVRFALATMPEQTLDGFVHRLGARMDITDDGEAVLFAEAAVDAREIPVRTSGTQVFARIYCGRESLAYWLFGDAVEFVQRRVW